MGTRSRILLEVTDPMPFIALPRNTFPRGPKMMLTRIRGSVFSWSRRVCVTYLRQSAFQNSKNQQNKTPVDLGSLAAGAFRNLLDSGWNLRADVEPRVG